jgi:predicted amidohydrolase YtcJ
MQSVVVTQNLTHLAPLMPNGKPPQPVDDMAMLRSLLKAGVPPALGSDAGPTEANPFLNMTARL